jgi:hypothetical protein
MLRLDVIYMTPIDIYQVCDDPVLPFTNQGLHARRGAKHFRPMKADERPPTGSKQQHCFYDIHNQYVMIPGFASYPANDRLIIGPHDGVKIWATQRWDLYEQHVQYMLTHKTYTSPDYGLHDEGLVGYTLLPKIENDLQYKVMMDRHMYFFRVRADGAIWLIDSPYEERETTERVLLETLLGRNCTQAYKPAQMKCPPPVH